jgi:hypothetical protein
MQRKPPPRKPQRPRGGKLARADTSYRKGDCQGEGRRHAVAYLRDELGEERFAVFLEMFKNIYYVNGMSRAIWRIGKFVPHVACGDPINPETGDKASEAP